MLRKFPKKNVIYLAMDYFFSTGFIDLMLYLRIASRTKRALENPPDYQRYIYY